MEGLVGLDPHFWHNRRVAVTGHTGFKGSWLTLWLHQLGAHVSGFALDPEEPSLFSTAQVGTRTVHDVRANLLDFCRLEEFFRCSEPEVVFHLAAQPLVRESYRRPLETFQSNVLGTIHLLEVARHQPGVRAVVVVTTDKVYENRESLQPYQEADRLGGKDPYSASKAAAELAVASYRESFLSQAGIAVSTVRAGNVIGGGDFSPERLIPDCLRAFSAGQTLRLRAPNSIRPWQHVLEPLAGYLRLGQLLFEGRQDLAKAWNFGPNAASHSSVREVVGQLAQLWDGETQVVEDELAEFRESCLLCLDSSLAQRELGWSPIWTLQEAIQATVEWHAALQRGQPMDLFTIQQISTYRQRTRC